MIPHKLLQKTKEPQEANIKLTPKPDKQLYDKKTIDKYHSWVSQNPQQTITSQIQ